MAKDKHLTILNCSLETIQDKRERLTQIKIHRYFEPIVTTCSHKRSLTPLPQNTFLSKHVGNQHLFQDLYSKFITNSLATFLTISHAQGTMLEHE